MMISIHSLVKRETAMDTYKSKAMMISIHSLVKRETAMRRICDDR